MVNTAAMNVVCNKTMVFAIENPVKFVALGSFSVLATVPVLSFAAYGISTLVATIVGALLVEVFLLAVGITGLAFVLFFVTCISMCVTSVFGALYFGYHAASTTLSKTKGMGFRLSRTPAWPYTSNTTTETAELHEAGGGDDTDKTK